MNETGARVYASIAEFGVEIADCNTLAKVLVRTIDR